MSGLKTFFHIFLSNNDIIYLIKPSGNRYQLNTEVGLKLSSAMINIK